MALQNLVGQGRWLPPLPEGIFSDGIPSVNSSIALDADEEEWQWIGRVRIDGGGSKTFGTSSILSWLPGAAITFVATATLRVGVKKAASIDAANGPPARATIGAAAFDVYKDLVGGTDTITASTYRNEAMASGTPFTVTDGDLLAVCFHLDITANAQSVLVRNTSMINLLVLPVSTLVTSGPTYTAQTVAGNVVIAFDDGTLGWIEPTYPFSNTNVVVATASIGNGNIIGNIFRTNYSCKVDAIAAILDLATGSDCALELYSTPLGTPVLIESVAIDQNITGTAAAGMAFVNLTTPRTLTINTDYLVGIKQTTATALTGRQHDVDSAAHFKPLGMGAECYAADSVAGATFAQQNSGKRRYSIWVRVSASDDGVSAGGGANRALLPSGVSALG